jgi:hypothetical protein
MIAAGRRTRHQPKDYTDRSVSHLSPRGALLALGEVGEPNPTSKALAAIEDG